MRILQQYVQNLQDHNIIHIHDNVLWDLKYSMERTLTFPTIKLTTIRDLNNVMMLIVLHQIKLQHT